MKAAGIGIAAAVMLVGAVAIGYVIADRTNVPPTTTTRPTPTTTTTRPTTTTAPTTTTTTSGIPSFVDNIDHVFCTNEWFHEMIAEITADAGTRSYQIFTFDNIQRIRKTSNKLWCQASVRASVGTIDHIEYTIEDLGAEGWYATVRPITARTTTAISLSEEIYLRVVRENVPAGYWAARATDYELIDAAKAVCATRDDGTSFFAIELELTLERGIDGQSAVALIWAGVPAFCPEYQDEIP